MGREEEIEVQLCNEHGEYRAQSTEYRQASNNKYKETTMAHFSLGLTTNCLGTDSTLRVWRHVRLVILLLSLNRGDLGLDTRLGLGPAHLTGL